MGVRAALLTGLGGLALAAEPGLAQQIVPDTTLGAEGSSLVIPFNDSLDLITGGLESDINLFHSFEEFGIEKGRAAGFIVENRVIENIFARVTGTKRSEIFGALGTFGFFEGEFNPADVNLFLINPNGILFGPESELDIGTATRGSFFATTLDGFVWSNSGRFDGVNPQGAEPLLEIVGDPRFFLATNRLIGDIQISNSRLDVRSGQSLSLLGGNVAATNAVLSVDFPDGGRIEIGAVAQAGTVPLAVDGNSWSLQMPADLGRGNVSLASTRVDVVADNGGDLSVYGNDVEISNGSRLQVGIREDGGFEGAQAGLLLIDAQGKAVVEGTDSFILNTTEGIGDAGDVKIVARQLSVSDEASLDSISFGKGNAGNVLISASDQVLFQNGVASSSVDDTAVGSGGDVVINSPVLRVIDGAALSTSIYGKGNAGNIHISSSDQVVFENGSALSVVSDGAVGNGGDIVIHTAAIQVTDSRLATSTDGTGNAGDIRISSSQQVLFQQDSKVSSGVFDRAVGNGGNIVIDTPMLEVVDKAVLSAETSGKGNAGDVRISSSEKVILRDGFVKSDVQDNAVGSGGDIVINVPILEVTNGATVFASTLGEGNAGNVEINAEKLVHISQINPINGVSSGVFTSNATTSNGKGGEVRLTTPDLIIRNGGIIDARTVNAQPGGNINLELKTLEILNGGQVRATSDGSGPAGNINITATDQIDISGTNPNFTDIKRTFELLGFTIAPTSEFSALTVRSEKGGPAGNIILNSRNLTLNNSGQIIAESNIGNGGSIFIGTQPQGDSFANVPTIAPDAVILRNNSLISATAGDNNNPGDGGNITINTPFVIGFPGENSDIIANAFEGTGGNITINAEGIFNFQLQDEPNDDILRANSTNDISASSTFGGSGVLNLTGLNVDPARGAAQLPTAPAPSDQVDRSCSAQTASANSFTVTGRGGIPLNPGEPIAPPLSSAQWVTQPTDSSRASMASASDSDASVAPAPSQSTTPLIEASNWSYQDNGSIALTAHHAATPALAIANCTAGSEHLSRLNKAEYPAELHREQIEAGARNITAR